MVDVNTIMVIDDDPNIRELVGKLLKNEGYLTVDAADGREALRLLGEMKIDLCVLDLMMPNVDGFEFCRRARQYYPDMPVLMLTAKSEVAQKVKGFQLGADDYLVKPFEAEELIVRVAALLKRYKIASSQAVQVGTLTLDKNSYTVTAGNQKSDIPMKEFELIFKLASFPNKTFSRNQLIEEIWGYDFEGNERTLDVHINRLRERFPEEVYHFKIITVRGLGYRLEVVA